MSAGKIKGCTNPECERNRIKFHYGPTDSFCTKCGTELQYVCADCFRPIDEMDGGKLCYECEIKRAERIKRIKAGAGAAVALVPTIAGAAISAAQMIIKKRK